MPKDTQMAARIQVRQSDLSLGISLAVQWLRLHASTAGGAGSTPGQRTKILQVAGHGQSINQSINKNAATNEGRAQGGSRRN